MDEAGSIETDAPQVASPRDDLGLGRRQSSLRVPALLWALILSGHNLLLSSVCHHSLLSVLPLLPLPLFWPQFLLHRFLRQSPPVPDPRAQGEEVVLRKAPLPRNPWPSSPPPAPWPSHIYFPALLVPTGESVPAQPGVCGSLGPEGQETVRPNLAELH